MAFFKHPFIPLYGGFEHENEFRDQRIWKVDCPGFYRTCDQKENDTAMLIIPGGAYFKLNPINNGFNYAGVLGNIDSYVLLHTLPERGKNKDAPFDQAREAIGKLRESGYSKIGIMGTSAGGHVASIVHADFAVLFAPVITMITPYAHENSKRNLLGENPKSSCNYFSAHCGISNPVLKPTFILVAQDDTKVHIKNSLMYHEHLIEKNCPVEMHIFEEGDHDIGLQFDKWVPLFRNWVKKYV